MSKLKLGKMRVAIKIYYEVSEYMKGVGTTSVYKELRVEDIYKKSINCFYVEWVNSFVYNSIQMSQNNIENSARIRMVYSKTLYNYLTKANIKIVKNNDIDNYYFLISSVIHVTGIIGYKEDS